MGSPAGLGMGDVHPAHPVTLSGFWIYQYDVTVAQYRTFCAATGHKLPFWPRGEYSWKGKTGWDDPALQQHPIVEVSWDDAKAYADWAGVALPTEAQWEYTACGPQRRNFPWGGTVTKDEKYDGWDATKCANRDNSERVGKSTWPVGSFPADTSWCGAQDMAGNVQEWCGDWYDLYTAAAVTNPTGPNKGDFRVRRGGSWHSYTYKIMNWFRDINFPSNCSYTTGFRCASPAPGPK